LVKVKWQRLSIVKWWPLGSSAARSDNVARRNKHR
jgi:hypothetical protein